jgi:hypothetical protein
MVNVKRKRGIPKKERSCNPKEKESSNYPGYHACKFRISFQTDVSDRERKRERKHDDEERKHKGCSLGSVIIGR